MTDAYAIACEDLHLFGYYRGASSIGVVKEGSEKARFISLVSQRTLYNRSCPRVVAWPFGPLFRVGGTRGVGGTPRSPRYAGSFRRE